MAAAHPVFNPHATLGALEVGVIISSVLFGVVTIQTYYYFSSFPKDSPWYKSLVGFVWICELGQTICIAHTLYLVTITFYGHPEKLVKAPLSLDAAILFSGFIGPLVQTFFAYRVLQLTKSRFLPAVCVFLSLVRFIGSVAAFVFALKMTSLAKFSKDFKWLLTAILVVGAAVDLLVAGALVVNLMYQRQRAYKSTVEIIDKLIAWTIETGLATSMTGLVMLACFLAMPGNYIWLAFFMFLARLFSNSLLASLNSRTGLQDLKKDVIEFTSHGPGSGSTTLAYSNAGSRLNNIKVSVNRTTDRDGPFQVDSKDAEIPPSRSMY